MPDAAPSPPFELTSSRNFSGWLESVDASLAFTTYQAGKLFFLGRNAVDQRLSIFERTFNRCMGLYADKDTLCLSTVYQIWKLENSLPAGVMHGDYDRVFIPQVAYTTGDVDVHDVVLDRDERIVFVSTLFSCLATVSERYSLEPLWTPPFVSRLAAEDRCHLNGMALRDGMPRYVTAVSTSDVADGWRDSRTTGGVVVDVTNNEIVAAQLSMPHSPRWYRGALYVLDSGRGYLGTIDLERGRFEPIAFCPGYLRGLAFIGDYCIVGLSTARESKTFGGLQLETELSKRNAQARCGLQVIDLRTGDLVEWVRIEGVVDELYDVVVLEGVNRPMAIGTRSDDIHRALSFPP